VIESTSAAGKKVVVVGGGPAGMEAARVAAERPVHRKQLYLKNISIRLDLNLKAVRPAGNTLVATLMNDLTDESIEVEAEQAVVERGTFPVDEVYRELRDDAANKGVTDIDALLRLKPQPVQPGSNGGYLLYRVGDAVSSRSLHAALLDAFRIAVAL
jgi:cation diffusion facilitator CzcD-associated flavoprotein CzcO